jgi:hypothetical protein
MSWRFVGRAEQLAQVGDALQSAQAGPVVITGEPGMGRTALLAEAIGRADTGGRQVSHVRPVGAEPLGALRASFPGCLPAVASPDEAATALARHARGHRMIIAADDAHLMDYASLLALRAMSRAGHAALLVSRSLPAGSATRPDPTLCLAYERDVRTVVLPPLSTAEVATLAGHVAGGAVGMATAEALHATAGGNPRVLRVLLVDERLTESMASRHDGWCLVATRTRPAGGRERGTLVADGTGLVGAIRNAWLDLAIARLDQLCRIALWCGCPDQVATVWPFLLLLRGNPDEALAFIDSVAAGAGADPLRVDGGDSPVAPSGPAQPHLVLLRAMILALGVGQLQEATQYLLAVATSGTGMPGLLLAFRAWLLAAGGQASEAASALRSIEYGDRETALFVHAARASMARLSGNAADTVFHLRRAIATAECCREGCPWMVPYLSVCLADALAVAGRAKEASSATARLRVQMSASGQYVGDILHGLAGCCGRRLTGYLAGPAPASIAAATC